MIGEQHVSTGARILGPLSNAAQKAFAAFARFLRSSPLGAAAVGTLVVLGLIALFAGLIAPHDPLKAYFTNLREPPSSEYLMGTDFVGRDVLSRIIFGSRITFLVAFTSITAGSGLGFQCGRPAKFGRKSLMQSCFNVFHPRFGSEINPLENIKEI